MNTILVIDDEALIRKSIKRLLEKNAYQVTIAESVEQAKIFIDEKKFDLILSDLRLPGESGINLIQYCPDIPIIIMTSYASVNSAVEAMKLGAIDYIAKPFDHAELLLMIQRSLKEQKMALENSVLKKALDEKFSVQGMIGECEQMQAVNQSIKKVSSLQTTVLILGETGTGKELVARAIHQSSNRKPKVMISINCAAISENLIESELFGYSKGAFTGAHKDHPGLIEAANDGTLFLDEIGELSLDVQAKLLRVLQEKEIRRIGSNQTRKIDIRLIVATHKNLPKMIKQKEFRSDLYFRLNVFEICLPPLRERGKDIVRLAHYLLKNRAKEMACPKVKFSQQVIKKFCDYSWPGNIREMQNVIERALILVDNDMITEDYLSFFDTESIENNNRQILSNDMSDFLSLDDYLIYCLENNTDKTETDLARQLGMSRKTLWEKRNRLNIPKNKSQ